MVKELRENYSSMKKDIETIKKNQSEMKNTISDMKNTLEGISNRLDEAEDQIKNLEDDIAEDTQPKQQKEKTILNMRISNLWYNMKHNNICIKEKESKGLRTYLNK